MKSFDLSIVIVHYNTPTLLEDCIYSIIKHTKGISYEVLVVDNNSTQGKDTLTKLDKLAVVDVLRKKENLGFAKGNNEGMKAAKGKYVVLLNSDTIITSKVFKAMLTWMDAHPEIGVATSALRNKDLSLQGTGGFFPTLFNIFTWMFFIDDISFLPLSAYHHRPGNKIYELDWITGAFFMLRREIIQTVGIFDPGYFMYVEDMDYCYRIKKAGWKIFYNPTESIIHLGGASSTKEFPLISEFKGILTFYKKHKPAWQYPLVRWLLKGGALIRIGILGILKGPDIGKIYAKAFQAI